MDSPLDVNPGNVWQYRQNKPIHVARDLHRIFGVPIKSTLTILMARGVCKWLAVRRDLIRLKNTWRDEVNKTLAAIRQKKTDCDRESNRSHLELWYLRGYLKALEHCRADVRALCHSERWRIPDHDKTAIQIMDGATNGEGAVDND